MTAIAQQREEDLPLPPEMIPPFFHLLEVSVFANPLSSSTFKIRIFEMGRTLFARWFSPLPPPIYHPQNPTPPPPTFRGSLLPRGSPFWYWWRSWTAQAERPKKNDTDGEFCLLLLSSEVRDFKGRRASQTQPTARRTRKYASPSNFSR